MPLTRLLSAARFQRYRSACDGDSVDAERLYHWNISLSSAFYQGLHFVEIGLRNAIDTSLRESLATNWLMLAGEPEVARRPEPFRREADYIAECAQKERGRLERIGYPVGQDALVSSVSFKVWVAMFGNQYWHELWRPHLEPLFGHVDRLELRAVLRELLDVRNRIAHHEPIIFCGKSARVKTPLEIAAPLVRLSGLLHRLGQPYLEPGRLCQTMDGLWGEHQRFSFHTRMLLAEGELKSRHPHTKFGFVAARDFGDAVYFVNDVPEHVLPLLTAGRPVRFYYKKSEKGPKILRFYDFLPERSVHLAVIPSLDAVASNSDGQRGNHYEGVTLPDHAAAAGKS